MNQRMLFGAQLLISLTAAGTLTGCMMDDDEPSDGGSPVEPTGLNVMTEDGLAPPDLSCLGLRTAPSGKESERVTLDARAFGIVDDRGKPVLVPGLEVQVFANNQIPTDAGCEAGCTVATDNGDGSYEFDAPESGWIAYRTLARAAGEEGPPILRTMEVNFVAQPEEGLNTIFEPVLDGLHTSLSIPRDKEAALVAGRFLDCQGRTVEGAQVNLRGTEGDLVATSDERRTIYIGEMGPNPNLKETTLSGQWSFINAPTNETTVVVEIRSENGVLLGCELAPVAPSAMSVVRIFPLRGDAAAICTE